MSIPKVNVAPPMVGPVARPIAEKEVAKPLSVPRRRRLLAEFVRRIVVQGKAKIAAQHFMSIMMKMAICCVNEVGKRTVNGVKIYTIGNMRATAFKLGRTP